jgi:two-component system LytT family response regulator
MIKAVLIDDEPLARSIVEEYLQSYSNINIVAQCNDGFEGLKAIMEHKPELVFLDIQMPKISGFELLELLEDAPAIIFTTAFDEFAMKAFDAHAIDYLLKPFSKERFDKAIEKWMNNQIKKENTKNLLNEVNEKTAIENRIVVKTANNIKIIPTQELNYIEAYDDYVKIHVAENCYIKKKTMSYYEKTLDEKQFVRIHRSYIVNINQITKIESMDRENHLAVLKNGTKLNISKTGYPRLKEVLGL